MNDPSQNTEAPRKVASAHGRRWWAFRVLQLIAIATPLAGYLLRAWPLLVLPGIAYVGAWFMGGRVRPRRIALGLIGYSIIWAMYLFVPAFPAHEGSAITGYLPDIPRSLQTAAVQAINRECLEGRLSVIYGGGTATMAEWRQLEPDNAPNGSTFSETDRVYAIFTRGSCTGVTLSNGERAKYTVGRAVIDQDGRVLHTVDDLGTLQANPPFGSQFDFGPVP